MIKSVLRDDGQQLNYDTVLLKSLTKACKLQNDKVRTRLPIRKGVLGLLIEAAQHIFQDQPYLLILYSAIFITAYFGLFRIGELSQSQHVVKAKDVHIGRNKCKLMFLLHTSKTHGRGSKPQIIKISSSQYDPTGEQLIDVMDRCHHLLDEFLCPYQALRNYMSVRKLWKSDSEQFFIFSDCSPVTPSHFRAVLKQLITTAKLDAAL